MNWVLSLIGASSYLLEEKRAFEINLDSYLLSRDTGKEGGRCGCWGPDKEIKVKEGQIGPMTLETFPRSLRTILLFSQGTQCFSRWGKKN